MIDTTDRHLVRAFCEQFRPGATEQDMQKPLFYLTPFITCSKCNSILFIDAANARCFGAPGPESVRLKRGGNETLAVCPGCAMTEDLQVGAHDFLEDIEDARSRRPVVLWCLHFVDVTRVHLTRSWVVYFSTLRPFLTETMLRAGEGSDGEGDEEAEAGRIFIDHGVSVLFEEAISESRPHATEVPLLLVSSLRVYCRIGSTWKVG